MKSDWVYYLIINGIDILLLMKKTAFLLLMVIPLIFSVVKADVTPLESTNVSLEVGAQREDDLKNSITLVDKTDIEINSTNQNDRGTIDAEKKIYELTLVVENQKKIIEKLEASQDELKENIIEQKNKKVGVDYTTWVSILLACVALLVTIFGVVMAIISFIGIKNIKQATNDIAESVSAEVAGKIAAEKVDDQLEAIAVKEIAKLLADGTFRPQLEDAVDLIMRRDRITQDISGFNQFPEFDEELEK
ncbi:hypothetical protein [Acinetobacter indicus]|uniref:hypothetical protein n=2 Tax=Acinetobacter indicus TaxID=756892 RepID=UPI00143FE690|nr:hypothetical protein [Acinetobacter indicus]MDM1320827.1 hypothetical protein [Acinetobacter indicus]QIZ59491.1 hypothetical protein FK537_10365 [Acinetobacter indicus]